MDTDSLYLALSEEKLEDVILPEKRAEWDQLRSKNCTYDFTANATDNFFLITCCSFHKKHDRREPSLFKEELGVHKCCVFVANHIVVMINRLTSTSLAARDSIKEHQKSVAMVDQC